MKGIIWTIAAVLVMSIGSIGMAKKTKTHANTAHTAKPLAERLGGYKAITAVVDQFVTNCATDPKINSFFKETAAPGNEARLTKFKKNLADQICAAGGGTWDGTWGTTKGETCVYGGADMKTAHAGMNIKDADFSALVNDLVKALDKFKVGKTEKKELLAALGGMHDDIVTAEAPGTATTKQ